MIIFGSNHISGCEEVLVMDGVEVFRFRESESTDTLMCDFDLYDAAGERIAKIAKSKVVYTAPGYLYESNRVLARVIDGNGATVASVERLNPHVLKISGTFHVKGMRVEATDDYLDLNGIRLSKCTIMNHTSAIVLRPGVFAIGVR